MSKKYTLLTFKGIFMNFLLELKFLILSHQVTSKQPREIVQIHMQHPVYCACTPNKYIDKDSLLYQKERGIQSPLIFFRLFLRCLLKLKSFSTY